jgi:hypothetical protein
VNRREEGKKRRDGLRGAAEYKARQCLTLVAEESEKKLFSCFTNWLLRCVGVVERYAGEGREWRNEGARMTKSNQVV